MFTPFPGAVARLHLRRDEPIIVVAKPPVQPTLDAAEQPGAVVVIVHIGRGASWPDRSSETWARAALGQGGIVVMLFGALVDAESCMQRLTGKRPTGPVGRA